MNLIVERLINSNYNLIPLHGKKPLKKWGFLRYEKAPPNLIRSWFKQFPDADIGIITGPTSNIMVLDVDDITSPYCPRHDAFTTTPSGGRHYYYPYHNGDKHGINVAPGIDIPWVVRFYDWPIINRHRIPLRPKFEPSLPSRNPLNFLGHRPTMEQMSHCLFIQWFREKRNDPEWDGRYALARAYASNVNTTINPDMNLGPGYRHEADIYARLCAPMTCAAIVNYGFNCPNFDGQGCKLRAAVTTPYALALRTKIEDDRHETKPERWQRQTVC